MSPNKHRPVENWMSGRPRRGGEVSLLRCGTHVGSPRRDAADLQHCLLSYGWTCFQEWTLAYWSSRRTPSVQSPHERVSHRWPHPGVGAGLLVFTSNSISSITARACFTSLAASVGSDDSEFLALEVLGEYRSDSL